MLADHARIGRGRFAPHGKIEHSGCRISPGDLAVPLVTESASLQKRRSVWRPLAIIAAFAVLAGLLFRQIIGPDGCQFGGLIVWARPLYPHYFTTFPPPSGIKYEYGRTDIFFMGRRVYEDRITEIPVRSLKFGWRIYQYSLSWADVSKAKQGSTDEYFKKHLQNRTPAVSPEPDPVSPLPPNPHSEEAHPHPEWVDAHAAGAHSHGEAPHSHEKEAHPHPEGAHSHQAK